MFSLPAVAGPSDFVDHGSYLTDTVSGLDWLDVTTTVNMSFNEVSARISNPLDSLYGWQLATGAQFNDLINHYTNENNALPDPSIIVKTDQEVDKIDGLVAALGSTIDTYTQFYYGQTYDQICGRAEGECMDHTFGMIADTFATEPSVHYLAMIRDDDWNDSSQDYTQVYYGGAYPDTAAYDWGSYLVRSSASATLAPVPEPETYAMMLAGLGLIGGMARRRKAKQ